MLAVVAVYPNGQRVLIGYGHSKADVDDLVNSVCEANGGRAVLAAYDIHFNVELAC